MITTATKRTNYKQPMRLLWLFYLTFLVVGVAVTVANAQSQNSLFFDDPNGCVVVDQGDTTTSCLDCLQRGCAWAPGSGFQCLPSCDVIADTPCYSSEGEEEEDETAGSIGAEEIICEGAQLDANDSELCGQQTDCASCTSATLTDGRSTCHWFPGDENGLFDGFCESGCTMIGCGVKTCQDGADATTTKVVDEAIAASATMAIDEGQQQVFDGLSAQQQQNQMQPIVDVEGVGSTTACTLFNDSCNDCVSNRCSWVPGHGCLDNCQIVSDTACYSFDENFVDSMTSDDICAAYESNILDQQACAAAGSGDCASCVQTSLPSDPSQTCQWFEMDGGGETTVVEGISAAATGRSGEGRRSLAAVEAPPATTTGYCSNECGMYGCGEFVCPATVTTMIDEAEAGSDVVAASNMEESSSSSGGIAFVDAKTEKMAVAISAAVLAASVAFFCA